MKFGQPCPKWNSATTRSVANNSFWSSLVFWWWEQAHVYMYACVHTPVNWRPLWFQHCTHPSLQNPQSSEASSPTSLWWNTADKEEFRTDFVKWIKLHKILLTHKKRNCMQRKLIMVHHSPGMSQRLYDHISHINVSMGLTTYILNNMQYNKNFPF